MNLFRSVGLAVGIVCVCSIAAVAQNRETPRVVKDDAAVGPRTFQSRNFIVHTDLAEDEAKDLLARLEAMLGIMSKYWGQPNRKQIECYVVKELGAWPKGALPPDGLAQIAAGAGVTLGATLNVNGRPVNAKAVVYAVADHGTPQHEAVHAYCVQNFGSTGPTWYSEGMAEIGNYWREKDTAVELPDVVLNYLKQSQPKPLLAIVDNTDKTGDSWQNYAWRWALCHMLSYNLNYAQRFRPLGLNLLSNRGDSFERTYGRMEKEIAFEYRFFLEHLENGLRADLITWDWKASFKPLTRDRAFVATVQANRGWQPSRLRVEAGKQYRIAATGTWTIEEDGPDLTADGDGEQKGRLFGIVLDPKTATLGDPFELGADMQFTSPADGNLYLRCHDGWGSLADNDGKITVKLSLPRD